MSNKPSRPLTGIEWAMLLCVHPELADECDWTLFDGNAWHCLLCKRPEFADRCDWSFAKSWNKPQGPGSCSPGRWYWVTLLFQQPQFADKCEIMGEFGGIERHWIETDSSFANKWKHDSGYLGKVQALFLKAKPEAASRMNAENLSAKDWIAFFETADAVPNEILNQCRAEKFTLREWVQLLRTDNVPPQILAKCPWNKFDGNLWSDILFAKDKDKYAEFCPWQTFDTDEWREILYFHKDCREQFDAHAGMKFEELHMEDWEPDWFFKEFGVHLP